jgi:K+-sensing histidine kinase KdpD
MLLSDLMRVLVLLLLYKWRLVQLVFLIIIGLTTIALSLPKSVFKTNASRILMIGTEVGFIILCVLFFAMYFLENSGSLTGYNFQLALSWSAVVINISIILFQIVMEIVEFFRLRREKKRQEQQEKAIQNLNQLENPSKLIEQSSNFNDHYNSQPIQISQLIQMPDVDETESATKKPKKYEVIMINRSGSGTRRTVSIDDANNS